MVVVLITGASRGLGLEFVRQYVHRGDRVIAASRRRPSDLPAGSEWVELDVSDTGSIELAASKVGELCEGLNILINNAGIPYSPTWKDSENFGTLQMEAMEAVIRTNTLGPLLFSQALVPVLKRGAPSVLAGVSSLFSSLGTRPEYFANNFGYSMSKVSLNMWLRSLSFLLAESRIMTVALDPGWVRTDMGGKDAPLDPVPVVAGMMQVIDNLTPEKSGSYLGWDGKEIPW